MWSPTHVQVTVQRARELISKGGHGGVFVTIALGKDKYQTSVKERGGGDGSGGGGSGYIEWQEKCELKIPSQGNTACIVLTVLTHGLLGIDNFLGCVSIPLADFDVYDRPKNKWYELQDRQGKPKHKERGELEVKIGFSVRPGSLNDVSKKDGRRGSLGQLSHVAQNVGGSLASISSVDKKSFKKLAKSITKKIKKDKSNKGLEEEPAGTSSTLNVSAAASKRSMMAARGISRQVTGDADPGVISDDDDDEFAFDELSHTGSGCSLEATAHKTSHHSNSATGSVETVASSELSHTNSATAVGGGTSPSTTLAAASAISSSSSSLAVPASGSGVNSASSSPRREHHHHHHHGGGGGGGAGGGTNKFNTLPSSKSPRSITPIQEKFAHKWEQKLQEAKRSKATGAASLNKSSERIVVGGEAKTASPVLGRLSPEVLRQYENKSREDLIETIQQLQNNLNKARKERKDLEDYIDNLLLRVMEHSPSILQNPYAA